MARFAVDGSDILRRGIGVQGACYPLVPFSNRIANGRLVFDGRQIVVAPNWPGQRHPMHGDGWSHAWSVEGSAQNAAEIVYRHDGRTGWPFRYRAWQRYRLKDDRLEIGIGLENLENHAVPAGIGLHPFFVRDADSELCFSAKAVWTADAEILPVERIGVPADWDFSHPRPCSAVALDNCFDGWDGKAIIAWPMRRLRLSLGATAPFRHLVVYTPPQRPFFCVEPVSHANGQLAAARLEAGDTLAGEIVFQFSDL